MMSKRLKILLSAIIIILCIGGILYYSEYRTMNFIDAFVSNPDEFEELVDSIAVTSNVTSNGILTTAYQDDPLYNELHNVLSEWEVKKTFKKQGMDNLFKISLKSEKHSISSLSILVSTNGILNVNGSNYQLVQGNTEDILELIQKEQS